MRKLYIGRFAYIINQLLTCDASAVLRVSIKQCMQTFIEFGKKTDYGIRSGAECRRCVRTFVFRIFKKYWTLKSQTRSWWRILHKLHDSSDSRTHGFYLCHLLLGLFRLRFLCSRSPTSVPHGVWWKGMPSTCDCMSLTGVWGMSRPRCLAKCRYKAAVILKKIIKKRRFPAAFDRTSRFEKMLCSTSLPRGHQVYSLLRASSFTFRWEIEVLSILAI